eukprot:SAG31_NODE_3014_length_4786_cov_9.641135_8_plen_80_part_00
MILVQAFDLFRGEAPVRSEHEDAPPTEEARRIKFTKKNHPKCSLFSPDGHYLVTGSSTIPVCFDSATSVQLSLTLNVLS